MFPDFSPPSPYTPNNKEPIGQEYGLTTFDQINSWGTCLKCKEYSCLRKHIPKCLNFNPYVCTFCQKKFKQGTALKHHLESTHNNEKFFCQNCKKSYSSSRGKEVHKCTYNQKFRCNFCSHILAQKGYMIKHLKKNHKVSNDFDSHITSFNE